MDDVWGWLRRSFVLYKWPAPLAFLYCVMAWTNPPPYLIGPGNVQRTMFACAAFGMVCMVVAPREMWVRNLGVLLSTVACT